MAIRQQENTLWLDLYIQPKASRDQFRGCMVMS